MKSELKVPLTHPLSKDKACTKVFYEFMTEYEKIINLYFFICSAVYKIDTSRETIIKVLNETAKDDTEKQKYQKELEKKDPAFSELTKYSSQLSRFLVTNSTDLFITFCKEIVKSAFNSNKDLLRGKEFNIRYEDIEKYSSLKEFKNHIIDMKISTIVDSIENIENEISKLVHINNVLHSKSNPLLKILINLRNLNVHNKGIVDEKFLKDTPKYENFEFIKGRKFHVNFDEFTMMSNNCVETAYKIDHLISTKHRIQRRKRSYWEAKK